MRITNPIAIRSAALGISAVLRLWMSTLELRIRLIHPDSNPMAGRRPMVYAIWHEALLLPTCTYARFGVTALISQHRDGELVANVLQMLGGQAVRGSTTRGAVPALREMLRQGKGRVLAITPDGPRGPRRIAQAGAIFLASKGGLPIVPCGMASAHCWRAPSWDRMILPRPGTPVRYIMGAPIEIPPDLDRDGIEHYRLMLQERMQQHQEQAEADADAGVIDGYTPVGQMLDDILGK